MTTAAPELLFGLETRPPWPQAFLAALAHLLAIVASIATAPLIIARGLELDPVTTQYVIGSALAVSGLATAIQIWRIGPFGSGLLSIQGTSFAFIGALMLAGTLLDNDSLSNDELLGTLLGSAMAGALVTIIAGFFVQRLARYITATVTGIAIFLLGLTLVGAAWNNFGFAVAAAEESGTTELVYAQGAIVLITMLIFATRNSPWLRLGSITAGLAAGMIFAILTGESLALAASTEGLLLPKPLRYPLGFDLGVFLVLLPVFFVTFTESIGDLTATTMLSRQPMQGDGYWHRIRGGVMGDGLNSIIAALMGTFPNTTFSQNNGVIQLTGVASRFVGLIVAALLVLFGIVPTFSALFQTIPGGVLHSMTAVLFAMIAVTGLRLLRAQPNQSRTLTLLVGSTGVAFALTLVPGALAAQGIELSPTAAMLCGFPVATGAITAMLGELLWR